ncbi:uncharacterized protein LOC131067882 [Cryptomeria japonica]|uniref:uncharacterized protein LOC131067882 n=1 Tax=Cryptomeria japonica TaxID=3369 RepID=UPI0027DA7C47|nr:uncharacterized protein LOC131067882 [Cryptomeria japonica]
MWLRDQSLRELINGWWSGALEVSGTKTFVFVKKLQFIKSKLKEWNRVKFGNIFANKRDLEDRFASLQEDIIQMGMTSEKILQERELKGQYSELLAREEQQEGLNVIPELITDAQNQTLMKPILFEEVRNAVISMEGDKAPGLDGFPAFFFQTFWEIVGVEVWEVVEDSRRRVSVVKEFNCTLIALIPKVEHPTRFSEF